MEEIVLFINYALSLLFFTLQLCVFPIGLVLPMVLLMIVLRRFKIELFETGARSNLFAKIIEIVLITMFYTFCIQVLYISILEQFFIDFIFNYKILDQELIVGHANGDYIVKDFLSTNHFWFFISYLYCFSYLLFAMIFGYCMRKRVYRFLGEIKHVYIIMLRSLALSFFILTIWYFNHTFKKDSSPITHFSSYSEEEFYDEGYDGVGVSF